MQEHIRRAHPEHYISKLPATEDSFLLMINTPPRERSEPQPGTTTNNASNQKAYVPDRNTYFRDDYSNPSSPRPYEDYAGGMIPAANALASLHHYKSGGGGGGGSDWDAEGVSSARSLVSNTPGHSVFSNTMGIKGTRALEIKR